MAAVLPVLLIFVLALVLSGCGAKEPLALSLEPDRIYGEPDIPEGYTIYLDETYQYFLAVPSTWKVARQEEDNPTVLFFDPQMPHADEPTAGILVLPPYDDLEEVADKAQANLLGAVDIQDLSVEEQFFVFVNGMQGMERLLRYGVGPYEVTQRTVYLRHTKYNFVLNFAARSENYSYYEPVYERMIHTFNLIPPEEL